MFRAWLGYIPQTKLEKNLYTLLCCDAKRYVLRMAGIIEEFKLT